VEVVGIEPTSASPTLRDLHAYSVFNLTAGYPTGRENSQPVQQGFNGSGPERAFTAVLCRWLLGSGRTGTIRAEGFKLVFKQL